MLGVVFTLLAAASFGLSNASVRRAVLTGTVTQAVVVSMPIGLVMFAAAALATGQLDLLGEFSRDAYLLLAAAGLVHFLFGRYFNYRSIEAMGANLSAPLQQWSFFVALALAIVFLAEVLTVLRIAGIVLMFVGPAMIFAGQRAGRAPKPAPVARPAGAAASPVPAFTPRIVEGYVFGILSCLGYGTSPVLVRAGLEGSGAALAGGTVSYGAAMVVILAFLATRGARRQVGAIDRTSLRWFLVNSVTVCISQMFLYAALALAPVTVVQPIMRFSTVFRTLFSWMLNREHESFEPNVLWAIAISIVGALALTIDAGWVVRMLDGPPWLAETLLWRWP